MTELHALRAARPDEAGRLTEIAQAAKAHWGYPDEWLELWERSLTFTAETLREQWVYVASRGEEAVAVVAVSGEPPTLELTHLWVEPQSIGRGLGRRLFDAAADHARTLGARALEVVSDPYAEDFYLHLGAQRLGDVASQPAGRRLPLLVFEL